MQHAPGILAHWKYGGASFPIGRALLPKFPGLAPLPSRFFRKPPAKIAIPAYR